MKWATLLLDCLNDLPSGVAIFEGVAQEDLFSGHERR